MLSLSVFTAPPNFSIFNFGKQTPVCAIDSLQEFLVLYIRPPATIFTGEKFSLFLVSPHPEFSQLLFC